MAEHLKINTDEKMRIILEIILRQLPMTQAIYHFGSSAVGEESGESDVDLAVLLPHVSAKVMSSLAQSDCHLELEDALRCPVDLINLRIVSTVFQKEIINGKRIFCGDEFAADEFEMLVMSGYQKLNEERAAILEDSEQPHGGIEKTTVGRGCDFYTMITDFNDCGFIALYRLI